MSGSKVFLHSLLVVLLSSSSVSTAAPQGKEALSQTRVKPTTGFKSTLEEFEDHLIPAANCFYSTSWRWNLFAAKSYSQEKYGDASRHLEYVLSIYPDDIVSLYNLAIVQIKLKQYKKAFNNLKKAAKAIEVLTVEKIEETDKPNFKYKISAEEELKDYKFNTRAKVNKLIDQLVLFDESKSKKEGSKK